MSDPIVTSFDYPPIPCRDADWSAYIDPEGRVGHGATEAEAIADLMEKTVEGDAATMETENEYIDALITMSAEQMAKDRKRIRTLEAALLQIMNVTWEKNPELFDYAKKALEGK